MEACERAKCVDYPTARRWGCLMLQPGDGLPAFTLRDPEREKFSDEQLRGSIAVMAFYPMSFTGG